jgi:hypothetical protein
MNPNPRKSYALTEPLALPAVVGHRQSGQDVHPVLMDIMSHGGGPKAPRRTKKPLSSKHPKPVAFLRAEWHAEP